MSPLAPHATAQVTDNGGGPVRHLVLVLGDQLSHDLSALDDFDPSHDAVLMLETAAEAQAVWSHPARIALFLSAMRHFADELRARGWRVVYRALTDQSAEMGGSDPSIPELTIKYQQALDAKKIIYSEPGEHRLKTGLAAALGRAGLAHEERADTHFLCSTPRFHHWARGRKELRMEYFYRDMRREHGVLMNGTEPVGGQWNFDADNRQPFPKTGPGPITPPAHFAPDATTRTVLALVARRFADHPGSLSSFGWPVTRSQALEALDHFVTHRLPHFGKHQDAMWTDTPWGWHALLSTSLNLHLLHPREVVAAAETAWRGGLVPLPAVEGFVRQVLGWREFIRGVYWNEMPELKTDNHFQHHRPLPAWYWTGHTHMACMAAVVGQTLAHGYAHHIQRLMVTGQFALLAQVQPQQVSDWYLAMYVDAVEWVELPNVAGMALFANGGRFTSKPYIASGQYIKKMSNHCQGCRYRPEVKTGPHACPVTTLYWAHLDRHAQSMARNPRTALMVKHVMRLHPDERQAILEQATRTLDALDAL
jgi:deoxyribodipyrimidine photolyase-related protein